MSKIKEISWLDALKECKLTQYNSGVEITPNYDTIIWCKDFWQLEFGGQYGINKFSQLDAEELDAEIDFDELGEGAWEWATDIDEIACIHTTNLTPGEAILLCKKYPSLVFQVNPETELVCLYQYSDWFNNEPIPTNDFDRPVWYGDKKY